MALTESQDKTAQTMALYAKKMDELDRKTKKFREDINTVMQQINELPTKLAGQSQEFIDRETKKLQDKLAEKTKALQDFINEKTKQIEDWFSAQKAKIEDEQKKAAQLMLDMELEAMKKFNEEKAKNSL